LQKDLGKIPKEDEIKHKQLILILLGAVCLMITASCGRRMDMNAPFAMALNGRPLKVKLADTIAKVREVEAGFGGYAEFQIVFPLKSFNPIKVRGFQLHFDPQKVYLEEEITAAANDKDHSLRMNYHPTLGHRANEGKILTFSSRHRQGFVTVRFTHLDPRIDGRISGEIIEAVLYAYYETHDPQEFSEPSPPKKLHIAHFPFDTTITYSPF
jgi:hypothetical protein